MRLADDPPEPYELATPLSIANAQAARQMEHAEWLVGVFAEFRPALVGFVRKRTEDEWLAEDIVQELFVNLLDVDRGRIRNLRGWLYRGCRMLIRHRWIIERGRRTRRMADFQKRAPATQSAAQRPLEIAEYNELRRDVDAALGRLGPRGRELVTLRIVDGEKASGRSDTTALYDGITLLRKRFADLRPTNRPFRLKVAGRQVGHARHRNCDVWCIDLERNLGTVNEAATFAGVLPNSIRHAIAARIPAGGYRFEWQPRAETRRVEPTHKEIEARRRMRAGRHPNGRDAAALAAEQTSR
jgi:RNA polymerase sigma factor (sigma-70 family)